NDAPIAGDDTATTAEDTAVVIDAKANDATGPASATDESGQTLTITSVGAASHGTASLITTGPNAGKILYTPAADYNGSDSFSYTITDNGTSNGTPDPRTAYASVSVTITTVNDAPIANPDTATTPEDTSVVIDARANDATGPASATDESGQTLTITS